MQLARVVGTVVATEQVAGLRGVQIERGLAGPGASRAEAREPAAEGALAVPAVSRLIAEHAARHLVPTPIYHAALQSYYAAVAQGHGDEDQSAVCAAMERAANCERGEGKS